MTLLHFDPDPIYPTWQILTTVLLWSYLTVMQTSQVNLFKSLFFQLTALY